MASFIKYRSVNVYFVFSFLLDFEQRYVDLVSRVTRGEEGGWLQGKPQDRRGKPPFLDIKKVVVVDQEGEKKEYVATSLYKVLFQAQTVKLTYREYGNEPDAGSEPVVNTFDVDLEAYARIFDNGAGCITYKVCASADVSLREIHHIFSLSQRSYEETQGMARLQINGRNLRLYDLFTQNLGETAGVVGSLVKVQDWLVMDPSK